MSLIDAMMENFTIINAVKVSDGESGFITEWQDGPTIRAVLTHDTTLQARVAEKEGVTSTYTLSTSRSVVLGFHDVLRRASDGATFRVTSNGEDKQSPAAGTLDLCQVSAEKWSLTT